jgi:hypothetical protein
MTRFVPVTVLVLLAVLLASGRVASADMGSLPNGAVLTFNRLFLHEEGSVKLIEPKHVPESLWNYFNLAHCRCGKSQPGFVESQFAYELTLQNPNMTPFNPDRTLEIWVGAQCDSTVPGMRESTCHPIDMDHSGVGATFTLAGIQQTNGVTLSIPVYDLMTPVRASAKDRPECVPTEQDGTVWAIGKIADGTTPDYFLPKIIKIDSKAPEFPTGFRAFGGDESIVISWTPPVSTADVYGYQALCARAEDDTPAKTSGRPDQRYMTELSLCGGGQSVDLGAGTAIAISEDMPADPVMVPPPGLDNLDPSFLCGEAFSPTATSIRIDGLENGVAYKVVLLSVDKFQNASGTFFTSTLTPIPSTDFWEDIHARGGKADGGLCLLAETYGDDSSLTTTLRAFRDDTLARTRVGRWLTRAYYATLAGLGVEVHGSTAARVVAAIALAPLVGLALLWHWLTLPGLLGVMTLLWLWRRHGRTIARRLPRMATAAGVAIVALVVLVPGRAHAGGGGYQPYWENSDLKPEDEHAVPNDPSLVRWHAGVRVGPYLPDIDAKLVLKPCPTPPATGSCPGSFRQMFHGARPMPMLDVDRILWTGFGQVGVGISIGYMQWFEHAFVDGSKPEDDPRMRSPADTNAFRLIPMALTATYRLTWFDDEYGVPVVPYVRGGLAYDLWWQSARNDRVCKNGNDPMEDPTCALNKPLGGSLGVTGSIGLAVRAERIDASTAMSMQQSGIQHAGIYAELSLAKVDGFGADGKLSVGDRTWFAGVDFEF